MIGVCGACILLLIEQDLITLVSEQVAHIYIYIYHHEITCLHTNSCFWVHSRTLPRFNASVDVRFFVAPGFMWFRRNKLK